MLKRLYTAQQTLSETKKSLYSQSPDGIGGMVLRTPPGEKRACGLLFHCCPLTNRYKEIKMKCFFTVILLACMAPCFAEPDNLATTEAAQSLSPEAIVDIQIAAYNQGDIEAFVATFAPDVKTYAYPNTLQISGIENLKKAYAGYFNAHPELHAEVVGKIIQNNFVIYREFVTGVVGGKDFYATAIYEVRDGKIQNIWFLQ